MVRSLVILLSLFGYSLTWGQAKHNKTTVPPLPLDNSSIVYASVITLDTSFTKEQLFDNGLQWYKKHLQSADNTLYINDADAGRLAGTGILHAGKKEKDIEPRDIFFHIDIVAAKGGYRYKVDSIYSFAGDRQRFYYSDMYSEELYTQMKPKWTKPYRQSMLTYMNGCITDMLHILNTDMNKR